MRKILRKPEKFNGYAESKVGVDIHIQDKHGNQLKVGDKVKYKNFEGIILYNPYYKECGFYYSYSQWYGGDQYDRNSYGRFLRIPMDNGAKMELEVIQSEE